MSILYVFVLLVHQTNCTSNTGFSGTHSGNSYKATFVWSRWHITEIAWFVSSVQKIITFQSCTSAYIYTYIKKHDLVKQFWRTWNEHNLCIHQKMNNNNNNKKRNSLSTLCPIAVFRALSSNYWTCIVVSGERVVKRKLEQNISEWRKTSWGATQFVP